jgi:hypothetical protein
MKKTKLDYPKNNITEGGFYSLLLIILLGLTFVFLPPLIATGLAVGVIFFGIKKYS